MLGYFPESYVDELIYSIFARYHIHTGNTSVTTTTKELFGEKRITAIVDFPCGLNNLISNIPKTWDVRFEELVYNNTLVPLFQPFWSVERTESVLKMMQGKAGSALHIKSGVNSNTLSCGKYLRFCPACLEDDIKTYGEAYWRRVHQVPGILVCPTHKEVILNSTVPIYGINPQHYQAANRENCRYYSSTQKLNASNIDKLAGLANDTKVLLNSNIQSREYDWYILSYKSLLAERGYTSQKGYINQNILVRDFIDYYSPELLTTLGIMPNIENKHNWVSMMARKSNDYPHPIEHLLFIKYLSGSIQNFFNGAYEHKCSDDNIIGRGPFPCLNAAADHYNQLIVKDVSTHYSRNKNLIATFTCSCGFSYSRKISKKAEDDIYKYDTIEAYGDLWNTKFKELIQDKGLHLREVSKLLKIDLKTVRKLVSRNNLQTKWLTKRLMNAQDKSDTTRIGSAEWEAVRNTHRENWTKLLSLHKISTRAGLKRIDSHAYYWLNKYDKDWLNINSPVCKQENSVYKKVNWEERDNQVLEQAEVVVNRLLSINIKPVRITDYRIGKELGIVYTMRNHIDKMPKTKAFLASVCESVDDYRVRRIKLAAERLANEGIQVKTWKIKELTGLFEVYSARIESAIAKEVNERS